MIIIPKNNLVCFISCQTTKQSSSCLITELLIFASEHIITCISNQNNMIKAIIHSKQPQEVDGLLIIEYIANLSTTLLERSLT